MKHRREIEKETLEESIETKYQYQHRVDKEKEKIQHEEDIKRLNVLSNVISELVSKRMEIKRDLYEEYNDLVLRNENWERDGVRRIKNILRGEEEE